MGKLKLEDLNYTYDDYKRWKGDWELIEGVPVAKLSAPTIKHQGLVSGILYNFRQQFGFDLSCEVLAGVDYKIGHDTVVRPDVVVTCGEENEAYLIKALKLL